MDKENIIDVLEDFIDFLKEKEEDKNEKKEEVVIVADDKADDDDNFEKVINTIAKGE